MTFMTLAAVQLVLAFRRINSCVLLSQLEVKIAKTHKLFVARGAPKLRAASVNEKPSEPDGDTGPK